MENDIKAIKDFFFFWPKDKNDIKIQPLYSTQVDGDVYLVTLYDNEKYEVTVLDGRTMIVG